MFAERPVVGDPRGGWVTILLLLLLLGEWKLRMARRVSGSTRTSKILASKVCTVEGRVNERAAARVLACPKRVNACSRASVKSDGDGDESGTSKRTSRPWAVASSSWAQAGLGERQQRRRQQWNAQRTRNEQGRPSLRGRSAILARREIEAVGESWAVGVENDEFTLRSGPASACRSHHLFLLREAAVLIEFPKKARRASRARSAHKCKDNTSLHRRYRSYASASMA